MFSNQTKNNINEPLIKKEDNFAMSNVQNNKNMAYENDASLILPDNGCVDQALNAVINDTKSGTLFTIQELDSTNDSYPAAMDVEDFISIKSEPIQEETETDIMGPGSGISCSLTNKADTVPRETSNATKRSIDGNIINRPFNQGGNINNKVDGGKMLTFEKRDDEQKLRRVLKQFDLEMIFDILKSNGITYRSLRYLSKDDLKDGIPHIGFRAEFREKLFAWRQKEFNISDEETSLTDLNINKSNFMDPTPCTVQLESENNCSLNIRQILMNSAKGKTIYSFYEKNKYLHKKHREYLITMIVEEVICKNMKIRPHDFNIIVEQIFRVFPSEREAKDFYFIPRQGRKNPSGKLYFKYTNAKSKKMKLDPNEEPLDTSNNNNGCISSDVDIEFDEPLSYLLKAELKGNINDWNIVCDKWQQSYGLRRKDLNELGSILQFLEEWPKYLDNKGVQLFKIDFNLRYGDKELMLFNKWNEFKKSVKDYYIENICKPECKELLTELLLVETVDAEDYILASLLTSVLQPTGRLNVNGQKKKLTILDSRDCFTLHLKSLRDYKSKIDEILLNNNMSGNGSYLLPIIIAVGEHSYDVSSFYIHFGKTMYKLQSYLECVDVCFKIYKTLNLDYVPVTQMPWGFIQKYFYEIDSDSIKSSNITALINFLKNAA